MNVRALYVNHVVIRFDHVASTFGHGFLVRLARAGRGMEMAFPSPKAGDVLSWSFSPRFLRVLTKYGFSLEMA